MVILLDFDEECLDPPEDPRNAPFRNDRKPSLDYGLKLKDHDPNLNSFSAILACYPIVVELASSLDLNTLHALSRTCHQFRANLLQFRKQLISRTLRCSNDEPYEYGDGHTSPPRIRWRSCDVIGSYGVPSLRMTSGKVGPCARDMVGECRRCSRIVCRNCTMKPSSTSNLPSRLRRLCTICIKAPLIQLTSPHLPTASMISFTHVAFDRESCSCPYFHFICQPCGHALTSADTSYRRIWTWRTRYSQHLGGLGTGIGEGNEGVKCGRGDHCLGAQDIEVELDCDADETGFDPMGEEMTDQTFHNGNIEGEKAGYLRQEIEGIGGVVRRKVKRRVRVGKTVKEYEDERGKAAYLEKEIRGASRSWCGWCNRVVPGLKDLELEARGT